jgi:predicted CoA-binding protein
MDPRENLVEDDARLTDIVRSAKRVAVLGIKAERHSDRPAYYVPQYLQSAGAQIVPVPVYYPDVTAILGEPVQRDLAAVPGPVDILDVFRRPRDIPAHLDAMKRLRPRAVWFQLGIRNDEAALELAREGILVVQDRCLMVEWRRRRAR